MTRFTIFFRGYGTETVEKERNIKGGLNETQIKETSLMQAPVKLLPVA